MNETFVFYSDKINYKSVEGKNGKEYFVTGYISTGDVDLVNDVVTKSCMDGMMTQFTDRIIKLDFEHEAFRGKSALEAEANKTKIVLGKALGQERDSKGVKITWQLNPTWKKFDEKGNVTMTFKDLWDNVEGGFYDAFSIAYVPTRTSSVNREGKNIRLLDGVNLLNVALTGNPINPGASMTAVMAKSLEFMKSIEEEDMANVEIKDDLFAELDNAVEELKTKYTRRTGSPGNYHYEYPDDNKKRPSSGKKPSEDGSTDRRKLSDEAEKQGLSGNDAIGYVEDRMNGASSDEALHNVRENNNNKRSGRSKPGSGAEGSAVADKWNKMSDSDKRTFIHNTDSMNRHDADKPYGELSKQARSDIQNKLGGSSDKKPSNDSNYKETKSRSDDRNVNDKNNERSTMENKDEDVKPDEEAQPPEAEAEQKSSDETTVEVKSSDFKELKDSVEGLSKEVKDLKEQNAELKAIVEKPQQKAMGAEKSNEKKQAEVKDHKWAGPLDTI